MNDEIKLCSGMEVAGEQNSNNCRIVTGKEA